MKSFAIPFIRPAFPDSGEIAADIDEIVRSNWFTNFGPKEELFARSLESYLGGDVHVNTFANGTLALVAAIDCTLGRGNGDRYLLMPSFTFIAVAQAAIWAGYRPWFVDIDPVTWQASLEAGRSILQEHRDLVTGIVLPNVFGVGNPDIGDWEALCAEFDVQMVIDSAAGFGSRYVDGSPLGTRGACEIFSFHSTKPFGIGEGGALVTHDQDLSDRVREFQNFGFDSSRLCTRLGMNGKLAEIPAAIGLRQLAGLNGRRSARDAIVDGYRTAFAHLPLQFQPNAPNSSHFCANVAFDSPALKSATMLSLEQAGVQARDYYNPALHLHPYFAHSGESKTPYVLPATEDVCARIVSLPVLDDMTPNESARVVDAVIQGIA